MPKEMADYLREKDLDRDAKRKAAFMDIGFKTYPFVYGVFGYYIIPDDHFRLILFLRKSVVEFEPSAPTWIPVPETALIFPALRKEGRSQRSTFFRVRLAAVALVI